MDNLRVASIAFLFAVGVVGCTDNAVAPNPGDASGSADLSGASGDGAMDDLAQSNDDGSAGPDLAGTDGAIVTLPDLGKPICAPSGNCNLGVACGGGCCGIGEACDVSGVMPVCKCGANPACTKGDHCASFGAMLPNQCGTICCGVSGPCPL